MKLEELPAFRTAFQQAAEATLSEADYIPKVAVEFELAPEDVTFQLVELS